MSISADDLEQYYERIEEETGDGIHANLVSPKVGDIEFDLYDERTQPIVDIDTEGRYVDKEPIGEEVVRQYLGPELRTITMIGECSVWESAAVDNLGGTTTMRTFRHSGQVQVDNTTTESLGKHYDGVPVYKYTIEMSEI
jgi:hypothetical protein